MSIHELTSQNFLLSRDQKTLKTNVPGASLVMFKMDNCKHCAQTEPIFRQLAIDTSEVNTYAVLNLSRNKEVSKMAQNTRTPIPHVPYFILYVNGEPKAIHKGQREYQAIKNSIHSAMTQIKQTQFVQPTAQQPNRGGVYGQGGYSHPQFSQNPGMYQPEMPKQNPYAKLNDIEEEDPDRLLTPDQMIPHNMPWESTYKQMGTID